MIILVILGFLIIIFIEVPGLIKKKMWRELVAFWVFLGIGMTLGTLLALGVEIPSPATPIEKLFKPIAEWLK